MPRRERPLDPSDDVVVKFAADLRRLREDAGGPTYRELSARAGYSAAALSEAAGGRKLPGLALTTAYVTACGGDVSLWEARWRAVAAELAAAEGTEDSEPAETESPYLGLAAFQARDASRFFGREKLLAELTGKVAERRFVGVFGASGSGKSSLLRAGLAATSGEHWTMVFTPGEHPLEQCAAGLANTGHLLIIDQFEEVFTLCHDDAERNGFINALLELAEDEHGSRVVIGVRADFYGHCGRNAGLVDALRDAQVMAGPMTTDELRTAIVEPAVRAGCRVEAALVTTLVADAIGQPAVLPLVSHALLETWRRRQGITLTSAAYEAAGGIQNAIAHTAEAGYAALEPDRQAKVRQIFLRLTALGEGTEDTKRRLHRRELDDDEATAEVLERLVDARLLALDRDGVEIAHEALIRSWPRLQDWLAEDREGHRLHRQLAEATDVWESLDRDAGSLYRGTRLALAAEWAARSPDSLTTREQHFLDAGLAAQAAEAAAVRRRTRRLRQLVALLGVLLVLAGVATGYAVHASNTATDQRNVALARKVVGDAADLRQTNPGLSVQLSLAAYRLAPVKEARDGLLAAMSTPFATRLAIEPGGTAFSDGVALSEQGQLMITGDETRTVQVWSIADLRAPVVIATLPAGAHGPLGLSHDGRTLATTTDDHGFRLWDLTNPRAPVARGYGGRHTDSVFSVKFSPDGRTLATAGNDGTARISDVSDLDAPKLRAVLGKRGEHYGTAVFSPDGRLLSTPGSDQLTRLWDVSDPAGPPRPLGSIPAGTLPNVSAFSPDSRTLATTGWDGVVHLFDVTDPQAPKPLASMKTPAIAWRPAFSPDGKMLAAAGDDQTVRVWDIANPAAPRALPDLTGHTNVVTWVGFTPDGAALVSASTDRTVRINDLRELALSEYGGVGASAFTPDGRLLVTTTSTGFRLWALDDTRAPRLLAAPDVGPITALTLNRDGRTLALALNPPAGSSSIERWDIGDPARPRKVAVAGFKPTYSLAFSPDDRVLAAGYDDGPIQLWDVSDPAKITDPVTFQTTTATVWGLQFTADGRTLISARNGTSPVVTIWDVADRRAPKLLSTLTGSPAGFYRVALSPDGRVLAGSSSDRSAFLWDMSDRTHPVLLSPLGGHTNGVGSLSFSPSGKELATAGADHTARLWDVSDPRNPVETARFATFTKAVDAALISPDGHTVVTASGGTVQTWETDPDRVAQQICRLARPKITDAEWTAYFPELPYNPPCP